MRGCLGGETAGVLRPWKIHGLNPRLNPRLHIFGSCGHGGSFSGRGGDMGAWADAMMAQGVV